MAIFLLLLIASLVFTLTKIFRIVSQAEVLVIERVGRYHKSKSGTLTVILPVIDRVRSAVNLREQVVSFPPQPAITQDNLTVHIDTVIFFRIIDPVRATYEINDPIRAVEQIAVTALRNVVGGLTLEETLTSREQINSALRSSLTKVVASWGLELIRVELKSILPPNSVRHAMEQQLRADREKRAVILESQGHSQAQVILSEGQQQVQILHAEGEKEAAIIVAEAEKHAAILIGQSQMRQEQLRGSALEWEKTNTADFQSYSYRQRAAAVKDSGVTQTSLAIRYIETLASLGDNENNSLWVLPQDIHKFLTQFSNNFTAKDQ